MSRTRKSPAQPPRSGKGRKKDRNLTSLPTRPHGPGGADQVKGGTGTRTYTGGRFSSDG